MNRPLGLSNAAFDKRAQAVHAQGFLPRGYIDGLTLSNDTTDATNDIAIAAGVCRSTVAIVDGVASTLSRHQRDIEIPVSIIKQLDVAWAPENYDPEGFSSGGRSGGRSTSSLSDTTWHVYAVGGGDQLPDVIFHDSASQSSILAEIAKVGDYTHCRRIGSILRSTSIVGFVQVGDEFRLKSPTLDINGVSQATTAALRALAVPLGIVVLARANVRASQGANQGFVYVSNPATTDIAGVSASTVGIVVDNASGNMTLAGGSTSHSELTDTSGQWRFRSITNSSTLYVQTYGWVDRRDRDS